jgi:hypothetical protein
MLQRLSVVPVVLGLAEPSTQRGGLAEMPRCTPVQPIQ